MVERLFVYGTLGLGRPNEHVLSDIGGSWESASVIGFWQNEGWGAEMGYPGLVLDPNGDKIEGFLFSSNKLSAHWKALDKFEGVAYQRVLAEVELADKSSIQAYVYTLRQD